MENIYVLVAGENSKHNLPRLQKLIKRNSLNRGGLSTIKSLKQLDAYKWDIVWNCSQANTQEDLDRCNAKVYINGNAEGFCLAGDKWGCYKLLRDAGLPQAKTSLENEFGYPVVIKYTKGSFGNTVFLAHNPDEENTILVELIKWILNDIKRGVKPGKIIYQEFIKTSEGIDICAYVVGDEVVACMKRENHKDFRSHVFRGGVGSIYELTPEEKELCIKAAKLLNLDYCSVNLLIDKDKLTICEVNSNAGTDVITEVTGVDIVNKVYDWAFNKLEQIKKDGENK